MIAEPGSVSFGTALWPHDDDTPVTKTVTYRNLGDQAVTLDLAASLTGPDGSPAPADALKLSATTVTVPAGGTATVQATSNTNHSGPDGGYSGRITATAGDASVMSAIGVNKEVESYNLTIKAIGPDGKPTPSTAPWSALDPTCSTSSATAPTHVKVRLPKGEYLVQGDQFVQRPDGDLDSYALLQPQSS